MHSNQEKWEYYKNISRELYKIIEDNLDLRPIEIIYEIRDHLDNYSNKSNYKFSIKSNASDTNKCYYIMYDGKFSQKELFRKEFNMLKIVRKIKIDDLLNNNENLWDE